jgi:two-component system alkaline phosphatase synthesis response regulator PhoP
VPGAARLPVLVVDDEPHIGRIIKTRLEQGPFAVTLAETGPDALAALRAAPETRLLILDLMLPGMSGIDILRVIRQAPSFAALPCLILTAAGQDAQYRAADALGVSEFMTKPFSPRRLFTRALALTGQQDEGIRDEESGRAADVPPAAAPDAGGDA